jgi:hypothetical protein
MDNSIYNHYKNMLISESKDLKKNNPKDKVYVRTCLNDLLDSYIKTLNNYHLLKDKISEKQCFLYSEWLTNLVCRLHPN